MIKTLTLKLVVDKLNQGSTHCTHSEVRTRNHFHLPALNESASAPVRDVITINDKTTPRDHKLPIFIAFCLSFLPNLSNLQYSDEATDTIRPAS